MANAATRTIRRCRVTDRRQRRPRNAVVAGVGGGYLQSHRRAAARPCPGDLYRRTGQPSRLYSRESRGSPTRLISAVKSTAARTIRRCRVTDRRQRRPRNAVVAGAGGGYLQSHRRAAARPCPGDLYRRTGQPSQVDSREPRGNLTSRLPGAGSCPLTNYPCGYRSPNQRFPPQPPTSAGRARYRSGRSSSVRSSRRRRRRAQCPPV